MNILLVRSGGLGDCILTLPVVSCLKRIKVVSAFHVLGNGAMLSLARLTGEFDGMHSFDYAGFASLFTKGEPSGFLRSFFSQFEEVYFFTAGDSDSVKMKVTAAGAGACRTLNPMLPESWQGKHITSHLLNIIDGSGEDPRMQCNSPLKPLKKPGEKRKGLLIHPGSGDMKKNWPVEMFLAVADRWQGEVAFVLGPAEIERGFEKEIPEERFTIHLTETLVELYDLLSGASFYVGNDSGVSHFADFCGVRGAVLFGPTDPVVWKPVGNNLTVVSSGDGTMEGIDVEEVLEALEYAARL